MFLYSHILVFPCSHAPTPSGTGVGYGLQKRLLAVKGTRSIGKKDMLLNDSCPLITVDPETYHVTADGLRLTCAPAEVLPMTQRYFLF
jgi:urease subunit alpha